MEMLNFIKTTLKTLTTATTTLEEINVPYRLVIDGVASVELPLPFSLGFSTIGLSVKPVRICVI